MIVSKEVQEYLIGPISSEQRKPKSYHPYSDRYCTCSMGWAHEDDAVRKSKALYQEETVFMSDLDRRNWQQK